MTSRAWHEVPIGALYRRRAEDNRPELPLLSVYRDLGVVPREGREDNFNKPSEDLSAYQVVRPGYLVVNKMKTWQGSLGISEFEGIVSPAYFVAEQIGDVEPRFMHHLLRSAPLIAEYAARSKGIRPNQWDLPWEEFRGIRVQLPGVPEQRAVADYLDTETARIDALVDARSRMLQVIDERLDGFITRALDHGDWPSVPLKWRTHVTVGIVVRPSELYADTGVPCLRGLNVRAGVINDADLVHISVEANAANAKSMLREGDVVIVRTGNAGAASVVPSWAVGGNCVDLLIARRATTINPRFLEAVLNSAVVRRQIEDQSVGALQAHFNTESLAALRVPIPDREQQAKTLTAIDAARASVDGMRTALMAQINLLGERRQALIAAAIGGEIKISGAAA